MAGAGIEVRLDEAEHQKIIDALHKAASPDLQAIAGFAGEELYKITMKAFDDEADPATGAKWKALKRPRAKRKMLQDRGTLRKSITFNAFGDGSVIIGSNLVYAGIHQFGGRTKAHTVRARHEKALAFNGKVFKSVRHPGSDIPARPYLGVPEGFQDTFFSDPAIRQVLGIAAGAE